MHRLKDTKSSLPGSRTFNSFHPLLPFFGAYDLEDVKNMDETGLFYNLAPDKTIARRQIEGMKKNKIRLSVALTANATGRLHFARVNSTFKVSPGYTVHSKQNAWCQWYTILIGT